MLFLKFDEHVILFNCTYLKDLNFKNTTATCTRYCCFCFSFVGVGTQFQNYQTAFGVKTDSIVEVQSVATEKTLTAHKAACVALFAQVIVAVKMFAVCGMQTPETFMRHSGFLLSNKDIPKNGTLASTRNRIQRRAAGSPPSRSILEPGASSRRAR